MDLSGTIQGASGVGGLLAVNEIQFVQVDGETVMQAPPYYPTFDGNEYLASDGTVEAHYDRSEAEMDNHWRPLLCHCSRKGEPFDGDTGSSYGKRWSEDGKVVDE